MVSNNFPNRPFRLEETTWLLRQDVAGNYSVVRAQLWIKKNSYSPTFSGATSSFSFNVNGGQVAAGTFTFDFRNSDALLLAQVDVTVPHNADGSKPSVGIDGYCNAAVLGVTELHGSIGLPTIPRASSFTISPSPHDVRPGQVTTININRASANFVHYIKVELGSYVQWIAAAVGASFAWTPPWDLLKEIPNADTTVGSMWIDTYSGDSYLGTTHSLWRLNAPTSVVPTVSNIAVTDQNPDVASIVGKFVQGLSRAKFAVTAAGVYGSTIAASEVTFQGQALPAGTEAAVTQSGALPVSAKVTDSRGRVGTLPGTLDVLPYTPPNVTAYQARRCNASGALQEDGAYLRVDLTGAIASLINGTQRNALTIRAFTRPRGTTAWTARNVITPGGLTYNSSFVVSGGGIFSTTGSWEVRVEVADKFGKYIADTTVSTITVTMDLNGKSVGVGKIWENGTLDVAGDTYTSGEFRHRGGYPVEPVGIISAYAGATAPAGWLLCDGTAVSRTTYAALFAVVGTAYGAGNGTSTFNLPNLKGRIPVGQDTGQVEFDVLGETGGAKTHTLTVNEMPSHDHGISHIEQASNVNGGVAPFQQIAPANLVKQGGGQAHNNLQPYVTTQYIVKAL